MIRSVRRHRPMAEQRHEERRMRRYLYHFRTACPYKIVRTWGAHR